MRVNRLRGLRSTWAPRAPKPAWGLLCCDRAPSPGVDFWRVSVFVCVLFFCAFLVLIKNAVVLSLRIVPTTQATRWRLTPDTRLASEIASRQRGPGCDGGGLVSQPPHSWVCCLAWLRGAHNKSSQTLIWPQSQPPVSLPLSLPTWFTASVSKDLFSGCVKGFEPICTPPVPPRVRSPQGSPRGGP